MKICVKAVIFDLDGVITNTMPDHYRAWRKALSDHGVHLEKSKVYQAEGQPGLVFMRELNEEKSLGFSESQIKAILREKERYFKEIIKVRYIIGARSLLKNLRDSQIILALVTGTARHELDRMLPESLRSMFTVIITGSDVQHGKPNPEPYLKSLEQLGIRATQAVVIENAPYGIQSAKNAGVKCFALETSLSRKYLKQADRIFPNIKSLSQTVFFEFAES